MVHWGMVDDHPLESHLHFPPRQTSAHSTERTSWEPLYISSAPGRDMVFEKASSCVPLSEA